MDEFFNSNFMPHGHCYFWRPDIVWAHAISDSIIAIAYSIIPLSLIHIVRKRRDFKYIWMGILFSVFILGCGTTHIFDVINIWEPWYITDSIVRVITAIASIGTAVVLIKITPQILLIPNTEKWKQVNEDLLASVASADKSNLELTNTEQILKDLNSDLENRVMQRTEEAIKKTQEFSFLADAIPQLVWTANKEGKADYFNKRWCEYTGLTKEGSYELNWSKIVHPDHLGKTLEVWEECLIAGKEFKIEYCLRRNDGEYRWFLGNAIPMKDSQGNIIKWFGSCTDIHDQKGQAKELEAKNKDLIRINNDLDTFIYTASHDLKAPISNMEGLLHNIYEDTKDQCSVEVTELFRMMETSIQRLKTTIHDLTDISRIQKRLNEPPQPILVEEILEEYQENHKSQLKKYDAVILTDIREKEILFSTKNFRSIFYNLINNSIKYHHPDRSPEIRISTSRENGFIVMSVADNGIGFDINWKIR